MMLPTTIVVEPNPHTQQDALELLLEDRCGPAVLRGDHEHVRVR
jgi:hypothetical protein